MFLPEDMDSWSTAFTLLTISVAVVVGVFIPNAADRMDIDDNEYDDSEQYYPPVPYNFQYNHADDFGNTQHREENKGEDGVVRGSYGYRDPSGMYRHVSYVADAGGFHAVLRTNEPGIDNRNSADVAVVAQSPLFGYKRRQERRSSGNEEDT